MGVKQAQDGVQSLGIVVIQKQTHPYAAHGGGEQYGKQQSSGHVVFPDIVLNIERLFRHLYQPVAAGEGVQTVIKGEKSTKARVRGTDRRNGTP